MPKLLPIPDHPAREVFDGETRDRLTYVLCRAREREREMRPRVEAIKKLHGRGSPADRQLVWGHAALLDEIDIHEYRVVAPIASGRYPPDHEDAKRLFEFRSRRAVLDTCLGTAFALGMFARSTDLKNRLTSEDPKQFWQAYAECFAAWVLAGVWQLPVEAYRRTEHGREPEFFMDLAEGKFHIEVKAPYEIRPLDFVYSPNDAARMQATLRAAMRQFPRTTGNVLIVMPKLACPRCNTWIERSELVRAFIGGHQPFVTFNRHTGQSVESGVRFFANGPLAKFVHRPDGVVGPQNTRLSAVILLQERWALHSARDTAWVEPHARILCNPYARVQLPSTFDQHAPCLRIGSDDNMRWTDEETKPQGWLATD